MTEQQEQKVHDQIIVNPEYIHLIPEISNSEFEVLKESISSDGQHIPIIINPKGEILDGHTRFKACNELGIVPRTMVREFEDPLAEKKFIIDINRNRRHLNPFQRIELEYKYEAIESELAKRRMLVGKKIDPASNEGSKTGVELSLCSDSIPGQDTLVQNYTRVQDIDSQAADRRQKKGRVIDLSATRANVSPMTYFMGKEIIKNSHAQEELQKLRDGKLKISKVYRYDQKQKKLSDLKAEPRLQLPGAVQLFLGDCREVLNGIPDNSIDLIFTDPPYAIEYLYLYEWLGKFAFRVLKPGGSLITYLGQYAILQEGKAVESSGLRCIWTHAVLHTGDTASQHAPQVFVTWKPLLEFLKGDRIRTPDFMKDSVVVSEPPDKSLHEWAQSPVEAAHFISRRTVENDTVLDPFLGSGTVCVAALKLGRQFIGAEIERERFEVAEARISKYQEEQRAISNTLPAEV